MWAFGDHFMSDVAVAVAECSPLSCVAVREWHATVWSWRERNGFGRGVREMGMDAYTWDECSDRCEWYIHMTLGNGS